jgi:hypothetical protein
MGKRVVIIASGKTERNAIPHLISHLRKEGNLAVDIRIPDRNKQLTIEMAEKLVRSAWYEQPENTRPDKFVILLDGDGRDTDAVLRPFRDELPKRLPSGITAAIQFACAQRHLEAWYFADAENLRTHLNRDLGAADTSQPDQIANPKQHLSNLLAGRVYTAIVAEQIARALNGPTVEQRSPSFRQFIDAVRNGVAP